MRAINSNSRDITHCIKFAKIIRFIDDTDSPKGQCIGKYQPDVNGTFCMGAVGCSRGHIDGRRLGINRFGPHKEDKCRCKAGKQQAIAHL